MAAEEIFTQIMKVFNTFWKKNPKFSRFFELDLNFVSFLVYLLLENLWNWCCEGALLFVKLYMNTLNQLAARFRMIFHDSFFSTWVHVSTAETGNNPYEITHFKDD